MQHKLLWLQAYSSPPFHLTPSWVGHIPWLHLTQPQVIWYFFLERPSLAQVKRIIQHCIECNEEHAVTLWMRIRHICQKVAFVEPTLTICSHMIYIEPYSMNDFPFHPNNKPIPFDCHNTLLGLHASTRRTQHFYMLQPKSFWVCMLS